MPTHDSFTPLQLALRSKAEIGLARVMADSGKPAAVSQFIETRLADLSTGDKQHISTLAKSILAAGAALEALQPDERLAAEDVPTNVDLFGDEWEGKRVFWFGEWSVPGEDKWHKFSGTFPDLPTPEELEQYARDLAASYIEAYPAKFGVDRDDFEGDVDVRILGQEKAF